MRNLVIRAVSILLLFIISIFIAKLKPDFASKYELYTRYVAFLVSFLSIPTIQAVLYNGLSLASVILHRFVVVLFLALLVFQYTTYYFSFDHEILMMALVIYCLRFSSVLRNKIKGLSMDIKDSSLLFLSTPLIFILWLFLNDVFFNVIGFIILLTTIIWCETKLNVSSSTSTKNKYFSLNSVSGIFLNNLDLIVVSSLPSSQLLVLLYVKRISSLIEAGMQTLMQTLSLSNFKQVLYRFKYLIGLFCFTILISTPIFIKYVFNVETNNEILLYVYLIVLIIRSITLWHERLIFESLSKLSTYALLIFFLVIVASVAINFTDHKLILLVSILFISSFIRIKLS